MKMRLEIPAAAALAVAVMMVPAQAQPPYQQQQPYPQQQQQQQQYPQQQQQQYPQQQYPAQQQYPPQDQQQYPASDYPQGPAPYSGQAPVLYPEQLDNLVSRIALYPDPLLAQVLAAASYPDQVAPAATWAFQHKNWNGDQLARAISDDRLPWAPAVIALLPFPEVLDVMARDQNWTQQLGGAVLAQRPEVMDAVQRMRRRAMDYGYLRDNPQERVIVNGDYIDIEPIEQGYYAVPVYNPGVVFARPARGFYVGSAITFGPRIYIGSAFSPWGWGGPGFDWRAHNVIIDRRPWDRSWVNRDRYEHPYMAPQRMRVEGPRMERHENEREFRGREDRGRDAGRGRERERRDH